MAAARQATSAICATRSRMPRPPGPRSAHPRHGGQGCDTRPANAHRSSGESPRPGWDARLVMSRVPRCYIDRGPVEMGSDVLVTLWDGPTWASPREFPNKIGAPPHMHSVLTRQARKTALVATFACLGGFAAAAASPAHADPLSTATYRLEAADGATIA